MDRAPVVAIIGGSLGGLTAARVLRDAGCEVDVFERSTGALQGRGAGIAALEQTLRYPVHRAGMPVENFCSTTDRIRFLHPDGSVRYEQKHRYVFSSWNAVYRALMTGFPTQHYHLGHEMASFRGVGAQVEVTFANSRMRRADLLVCADGITSASRARLLPGVSSRYAGYVAWRGVLPESQLSAATFDRLHDAITYQQLQAGHILVYPIPAPEGSVRAGIRWLDLKPVVVLLLDHSD